MTARRRNLVALAAFIAVCEGVGALGSWVTRPAIPGWYATLRKPALVPPDWVFGVVWTTLFLVMGVAAFLVWRAGVSHPERTRALCLFAVQLALNALWSVLFFGLRNPGVALVEIVLLWLAIVATMRVAGRVSTLAAWLFVPYLAWVSFAVYLNAAIWHLN
jgi:tryptophan-rich sensory protein